MLTKYTISQSADLGFGPTNLRTSENFKRHPPVLHVFFSSACRILLDLWTFSPVRARALLEKFSAPRARTVQYGTLLRAPCMSSLPKRACQSARYGISGTNQPLTEHHRQATTSKIAWTMTMKIAVKALCLGSSEAWLVQAKSRHGDAGSKRRLR